MTIKYFGDSTWDDISREERFFCSLLFHDIRKDIVGFVQFLNNVPPTVKESNIQLNPNVIWEVGYEVCFYRDMIFKFKNNTIGEINKIRELNNKCRLPHKRTFDLCLFSDNDIVIIEAKVQQGLDSKQCNEFREDKKYMKELFDEINMECPNVHFIMLASSEYLTSNSFSHPKGVGKKLIGENSPLFDSFISWKQINKMFGNHIYSEANDRYNN